MALRFVGLDYTFNADPPHQARPKAIERNMEVCSAERFRLHVQELRSEESRLAWRVDVSQNGTERGNRVLARPASISKHARHVHLVIGSSYPYTVIQVLARKIDISRKGSTRPMKIQYS